MNIRRMRVYPENVTTTAPNVKMDHPINLVDKSLITNPASLPHVRFIFHEKDLFELTFKLLMAGMHANKTNYPKADLNKMELSLKFFVNLFFKLDENFDDLKKLSKDIKAISEGEIEGILGAENSLQLSE